MKQVFIYMFCLMIAIPVTAQRTQQRIAVGDDFFEKEQFQEAIKIYQRILRKEKQPQAKQELSYKVGDSYRRLLNYSEAKKWYTIALNLGYNEPQTYLHLSEMTLGLEEFDLAIDYIEKYIEFKPDDPLALKLKQSAYFARDNYSTETIFEVSNEKLINNQGQQWGAGFLENVAVMYEDQELVDKQFDIDVRLRYNNIFYWVLVSRTLKERIVFSSTLSYDKDQENGYSNIYQATFNRRMGDWDKPVELSGDINSDYYDGFLSFDKTNNIAYFMNSGGTDGNRATADIYSVSYDSQSDIFGNPQIFPFNSDEANIGYPSISDNGNRLYFASDMKGGLGGFDIYLTEKDETGQWGPPVNLGPTINTPFNDSYPFVAGNVLYFSSYGHPGFGGFDVFYTVIDEENGNYSAPLNMGVPINSSADDFGFIIDESYTRGFFSSNRPGGNGEDDLFSFRVVPKTFVAQGRVTDSISGEPIGGIELFFYDNKNNFYSTASDEAGFYNLPDLSTDVNYFISAYPTDYLELADTLAVKDQLLANRFTVIRDFEKNLTLIPVGVVAEQTEPEPKPDPVIEEPQVVQPIDEFIAEETEVDEVVVEEVEEVIAETIQTKPDPVVEIIKDDEFSKFTLSDDGFPLIYFDFGSATLSATALRQLDSVIAFLKTNPESGIIIHAHTDVISGYLFNFFLSQQRAQNIFAHLRRNGVDPVRVYPVGHGKTQLALNNAQTDAEHRLNRRATFESIPFVQLQAYLETVSQISFRYLNSIEKEAHFANGIEFMVQFMASNVPINPQYYKKIMENIPDVDIIYYYDTDRYHRYLVGSFRDFDSAFEMQRTIRELGYEIYVVAFDNGIRIPVSRARRLAAELK